MERVVGRCRRSRQPKRTRLPADLWQKAVRLAREHGLNKTATALGLRYDSLKKHLEAAGAPEGLDSASVRPTFLELLPGGLTASQPECTIEWADGGVEPIELNRSELEAITYMRKHWDKITLFLRHPGAPLDKNICEQALNKAILHRRNAYFYKTENGAHVGDLFMSLIHTCELNGVNPFDYLTELNQHASELSAHPADWMPWTYRDTMARQTAPQPI